MKTRIKKESKYNILYKSLIENRNKQLDDLIYITKQTLINDDYFKTTTSKYLNRIVRLNDQIDILDKLK